MIATAIRNHTQLLNYLVEKYNLKSYLEIGVQRPENNYDKIRCEDKEGCDPEPIGHRAGIFRITSDAYFNHFPNDIKKDLIFIDGLHHADQVKRDFENSLRCLNDGGFIVLHDTLPEDESTTHVPRDSKVWHGDVYKFAMNLEFYYKDEIDFRTVNIDCGCTIVFKSKVNKFKSMIINYDGWEDYVNYRNEAMKIIQPDEIEKYF